jgi:hypothetical protein
MKKIILSISLLVAVSSLFAQKSSWSLEQNIRYQESTVVPTTTMGGNFLVDSTNWSHGFFALTTVAWAEVLYGVTYSPKSWVTIGLMVGFEQNSPSITPRVEPMLLLKGKKFSWITIGELGKGEANYWWTSHLLYTHKSVSVGVMSRRFYGSGVQLKYQITKNIGVWTAILYDYETEQVKPTFSVKVSF